MPILLFCLLLISCFSQLHAESNRPAPTTAPFRQNITPTGSPEPNLRTPTKQDNQQTTNLILHAEPILSNISHKCFQPGEIININGQHLSALSNHNLVIKVDNNIITLKRLGISETELIQQLPKGNRLKVNHIYPLLLMDKNKNSHLIQTPLSIKICSFISNNDQKMVPLDHEEGEIIILINRSSSDELQQEIVKLGHKIIHRHILSGLDKTMLTLGVDEQVIDDMVIHLQSHFPDAVIDKNHHYQASASPRIYAADLIVWPKNKMCSHSQNFDNLSIGMIDGHIDQTHPALSDQNITVKSFLKESEQADQQHATAIATILIGNKPKLGFQGLLPGVQIFTASILRKNKNSLTATTEGMARAIDWLITEGVRLVNISLSGTKANLVLKSIFEHAHQKGLIIFSAAGNNGRTAPKSYPAALPDVIAITAIDAASRIYRQANQGDYIDFSAPGVDIWTIDNDIQGKYRSGTSYAAPYALAIAALYLEQNPSLPRDILYQALQKNSHDLGEIGHDKTFGWGLVNVAPHLCH